MSRPTFPADFLWGVATSSYQIEGATQADGRGETIWDRFAATPGNIADGTNGDVACDHYRRWSTDLDNMKWLGVDSYRFSIAWSRVLPSGRGDVNPAGLDFYDKLVDGLLERGIDPLVTLYHWDLPQGLHEEGGWASRDSIDAFVHYADIVSKRLGDRVSKWITHNEPWCVSILGHESGQHAPGHKNPEEALRVAHHLLVSHGLATQQIRSNYSHAEVGIAPNLSPAHPATDSEADRDAARQFDGTFNRWYLDPLFRGEYPADVIEDRYRQGHLASPELPFVREGDFDAITTPTDFLGINYYDRAVLQLGDNGKVARAPLPPKDELTDMGWEVYPDGIYEVLQRVHRDYAPPKIYITENGAAYPTAPGPDGRVQDERRTSFLENHVAACRRAVESGVPLAGYYAWSLLDNFEWAYGYEKRFGLFWVDYETQERTPKDSAHWYRDMIATNRLADVAGASETRRSR